MSTATATEHPARPPATVKNYRVTQSFKAAGTAFTAGEVVTEDVIPLCAMEWATDMRFVEETADPTRPAPASAVPPPPRVAASDRLAGNPPPTTYTDEQARRRRENAEAWRAAAFRKQLPDITAVATAPLAAALAEANRVAEASFDTIRSARAAAAELEADQHLAEVQVGRERAAAADVLATPDAAAAEIHRLRALVAEAKAKTPDAPPAVEAEPPGDPALTSRETARDEITRLRAELDALHRKGMAAPAEPPPPAVPDTPESVAPVPCDPPPEEPHRGRRRAK